MNEDTRPPIAVIGMGRAGGSFAAALEAAGHTVRTYGRSDGWREATSDAQLVLLCVPDREIAAVSAELTPNPQCVVGHVAGSLGLDVLAPHQRRVAIHPLMSLPDAELGAKRLRSAWFAVAGDPVGRELVASLGGRTFELNDDDRALYHATAAIASNHLVALLGQVERLSGQIGVPFQAFVDLARASFDGAADLGPAAALTGPAARGDEATIDKHRQALSRPELDPVELFGYDGGVALARYLASHHRQS